MTERFGDVTFKGNPLTVVGKRLSVGDKAPDFKLVANDLSTVTLGDSAGKTRLISVVPSLDTGICDAQTRRFNEEIQKFGDTVVGYTVSADLPFAQSRWCGNAGVENVITLSDHRDMDFGDAYGTHVKELRVAQRSVFVIDADDTVRYVEYVPEIAQHPNYEAALAALEDVAG
jgi:thiol peroxidase